MEAGQLAFVIEKMSKVYQEMSTKHLLPMLKPLNRMLALDGVQDQREIAELREKIKTMKIEADKAIAEEIEKNSELCREQMEKGKAKFRG